MSDKSDKKDLELIEKYLVLQEAGVLDGLIEKVTEEQSVPEEAETPEKATESAQAPADPADYVVFDHVRKVYHVGEVDIEALADATFSVAKGELAIVVGESGAGKTTLLNILGGMDTLTSGKVLLDGREISSLNSRELTRYRRYDIGFVFQFYNLVQNLTALENVSLATQICSDPLDPAETLKAVGLGDRMYNFPGQLSGGEQQRVAIARALVNDPAILFADEPSGNLDTKTKDEIHKLFFELSDNYGHRHPRPGPRSDVRQVAVHAGRPVRG